MTDIQKIEDKLDKIDPFYKLNACTKKALLAFTLGLPDKNCRKICHLSSSKWVELIHNKLACNYIRLCRNTFESEEVIDKNDLIRELVSRIPESTNQEAVQLINQISKMKNWEAPEGGVTEVNINFVEEPWRKI
jgi:hypothetical protein